jgi:hypothetical protein
MKPRRSDLRLIDFPKTLRRVVCKGYVAIKRRRSAVRLASCHPWQHKFREHIRSQGSLCDAFPVRPGPNFDRLTHCRRSHHRKEKLRFGADPVLTLPLFPDPKTQLERPETRFQVLVPQEGCHTRPTQTQ